MNKFITAVKQLNLVLVEQLLQKEPQWATWQEDTGKNALHYLCGTIVADDAEKAMISLRILRLLLAGGMDINAVHRIPDKSCGFFPATPLWYAYTRGRNEILYRWLLENDAEPEHCMYAIAWYDDVKAAELFKKHGATIDDNSNGDTPFLAAFLWKRFGIARWFLENGANVNAADKDGNTALFYARKRKYKKEYIGLLLEFGAVA